MALTIAVDNDGWTYTSNKVQVTGTVTFDSSYATGGEAIAASSLGLSVLESLTIQSASGYAPSWDKTNGKIIVYSAQEAGGGPLSISSLTSTAAAATTSAQDLLTAVIPAATLGTNGDRVHIKAWGITAANTQTKIHTMKFGATTIANGGTSSTASLDWLIEADVYRTGAATQESIAHTELGPIITGASAGAITSVARTAPTETLSGVVTISTQVTLGTASASDSIQKGLIVDYFPAAGTTGVGAQVASGTDLSAIVFRFRASGV